jgi:hypothetical protein
MKYRSQQRANRKETTTFGDDSTTLLEPGTIVEVVHDPVEARLAREDEETPASHVTSGRSFGTKEGGVPPTGSTLHQEYSAAQRGVGREMTTPGGHFATAAG